MKFKKFVKDLATDGLIYKDGDDRWLASESAYMLIPDDAQSVVAFRSYDMPAEIKKMITQIGRTEPAELVKAIMPYADGAIRDCVRVFAIRDGSIELPISNKDWSLIEKSDVCEILYTYDLDTNSYEGKALLVKQYPKTPAETDLHLVGIIFPLVNLAA